MSNDPTNNEVVAFSRGADGLLTPAGSFPTGGTGSGTIEDSANGLILANRSGESSPNNLQGTAKFLFATNAGSDSVSVFRVEPDGPGATTGKNGRSSTTSTRRRLSRLA
jgi:hypothetical protein